MSTTPFRVYHFFSLLGKCTATATPGSQDSLVTSVCYDSDGCCSDEQQAAPVTMSANPEYSSCVMASATAEQALACTG